MACFVFFPVRIQSRCRGMALRTGLTGFLGYGGVGHRGVRRGRYHREGNQ